jgi:single-strand DNA-binding protein
MLNRFSGIGNLTQDPQTRMVSDKYNVCKFTIAINNPIRKTVMFLDIETWGKTAENCQKFISKGSSVAVDGRLDVSNWEDKNGNKRNKIFCTADSVHFLKSKNTEADQNPSPMREEIEEDPDEVPF